MRNKIVNFGLVLIISLSSCMQPIKELPVIKASTSLVDIRKGDGPKETAWRISPEVRPDVFKTTAREVTFYTDVDSITVKVGPEMMVVDFVILLNGTDSAFTRVQYVPSYLETLKKAAEYNTKDTSYIPAFTYLPAADPRLVKLRETYKLDSIAGQGNEISKMINLLYWMHNVVRHDGGSYNPKSKNADDLIRICRREGRGINCRMMATALNECYLAMGFPARFITCMPREMEFDDCHVINIVYSRDLQKWVWMDPTFGAYVMDETGTLLGPAEVRERLVKGLPLIINPDASWNRELSKTKEDYLDNYMAKNLYRIQCPASSEYDTETYHEGMQVAYVELLPLDGIEQQPRKVEARAMTTYKTNNPEAFWAKP